MCSSFTMSWYTTYGELTRWWRVEGIEERGSQRLGDWRKLKIQKRGQREWSKQRGLVTK